MDAIHQFNDDHDFLTNPYFNIVRTSNCNGGEFDGPCPLCGGDDRLSVWPYHVDGAQAWCRACELQGDPLRWAMFIDGEDPGEPGATSKYLTDEGYLEFDE